MLTFGDSTFGMTNQGRLSGTGYAYAYSTTELNRVFVQALLNNVN